MNDKIYDLAESIYLENSFSDSEPFTEETTRKNVTQIAEYIERYFEETGLTLTSANSDHYRIIPDLQAWDFACHLPYDLGTALAYLFRAERKGNKQADLQKALDHIQHFITSQTQPVELPRDYPHLFRKYFKWNIAEALILLWLTKDNKEIDRFFEVLNKAIEFIAKELNETKKA